MNFSESILLGRTRLWAKHWQLSGCYINRQLSIVRTRVKTRHPQIYVGVTWPCGKGAAIWYQPWGTGLPWIAERYQVRESKDRYALSRKTQVDNPYKECSTYEEAEEYANTWLRETAPPG